MSNESWWVFLAGVSLAALVYCAVLFVLILTDKRKNPVTKMLERDEALRLWVNHKKAEAWDEGYVKGSADAWKDNWSAGDNPYQRGEEQ